MHNWGLTGVGVVLAILVCSGAKAKGPPAGERPCFPCAGSWELWALQAWGEHYCGLRYDVQRSNRITFGVVVLLQGVLFATLSQWIGMLVCIAVVLLTFLRHMMAYRERPWGWLIGEDSRAFGCLGLPQWVYEGDADSDSDWDTPGDSQGGSESPALSCFESRAPVQRKPVCWADLAEEEEMEIKMTSQAKTRPKVSWADLQEDSEEPSWTWN
ncbi:unnamed protein product [Effrenium voratum]|nr:unnamed protein product [Effrenium voratum]